MKKCIAFLLTIILLLLVMPVAMADDWYCPQCGRKNNNNFCAADGTKRPDDVSSEQSGGGFVLQMYGENSWGLKHVPTGLEFPFYAMGEGENPYYAVEIGSPAIAKMCHYESKTDVGLLYLTVPASQLCGVIYNFGLFPTDMQKSKDADWYFHIIRLTEDREFETFSSFPLEVELSRMSQVNSGVAPNRAAYMFGWPEPLNNVCVFAVEGKGDFFFQPADKITLVFSDQWTMLDYLTFAVNALDWSA